MHHLLDCDRYVESGLKVINVIAKKENHEVHSLLTKQITPNNNGTYYILE